MKHNGQAAIHCDNAAIERLIISYQSSRDQRELADIIALSQRRAETLIRHHKTNQYRSESELLSDINFKLLRSIHKFDPSKGSGFTYISKIIDSSLRTSVSNQRRAWQRYAELSSELSNTIAAQNDDYTAAEDLVFKIKSKVKTTLIDEVEINAQRWFVESFCQEGFTARRHTCADACMSVHQLSHERSRELHDLTALEVRRALFDDLKRHKQIVAGRLYGTRMQWMVGFSDLLSAAEFTKFYFLMKNLAPYLLLLIVDPAKKGNHRRDRCPTIGRHNLDLILHGDPDGVLLFGASISSDNDAILDD